VVTNVGECSEVVGDTGRIVPKQNPEQLDKAILELLNLPPSKRLALGQAARHRVCERYDIVQIVAQYRTLWRELASIDSTAAVPTLQRAA
jgi:glycosyltransferase involved in cell wall biosynthesis